MSKTRQHGLTREEGIFAVAWNVGMYLLHTLLHVQSDWSTLGVEGIRFARPDTAANTCHIGASAELHSMVGCMRVFKQSIHRSVRPNVMELEHAD